MKHTLIVFLSLILFSSLAHAQTNMQMFSELLQKEDTAGQRQLLEKWEKTGENDPDLYVAYFNYYVNRGKKEYMVMGADPGGKESLELVKEDGSKEPLYLYAEAHYDPVLLSQGFNWIGKGIEKFPKRLDMRFGRIYMLGQVHDYERYTSEIIATINYSDLIKNDWTWSGNKPVKDPQHFMLGAIQDYQVKLYELGTASSLIR